MSVSSGPTSEPSPAEESEAPFCDDLLVLHQYSALDFPYISPVVEFQMVYVPN